VLVHTDYKANNYRVLESSFDGMFKPIDDWKVLLPEGEHYMESFIITKDRMFAEYLVNACSEVRVFDHNGVELEKLPLPPFSSLAGLSCRRDEREFFYGVETFVFPKVLYRFNPDSSEYSEYRRTENPIDPDAYDVKQEWYASKDGTQIPMFVFHKKGVSLDSKNPTVLYGYGGFNSSEVPMFMRNWVPWIERGGVFVVANIRGGGEFGNMWHKGGVKKNKQNTFDDFIAAGEHLISQKYTSTEYLGILGGSNGGLLTAAVSVQRPDLFQAACSRVPLTDMVRFPKFGIAMRWVHEYGDPQIKEDLENILRWSPYHNVKAGVKYPSFFFTTADKDTRVDSLHARKMTAALEDATSANKVLLSTEVDAGHGSGKPVIKIVESQALVLAFFANELGLKM
jgi:prolyl oligopeptidase